MKKKLFVISDVADIDYFNVDNSCRSYNDFDNKIREHVIESMPYIDNEYFDDNEYGESWKKLKNSFEENMRQICPLFHRYKIKHMAGRKNNYDYEITFLDESNKIITSEKLEFKFNVVSLSGAPQFVSPMKPSQYLSESYEDYHYDKYIVEFMNKYGLALPEKEEYLKEIHSNKPKCMVEAQTLYYQGCNQSSKYDATEKAIEFYNSSNIMSKESIKKFIEKTELDIQKLSEYLVKTQNGKIYLLYKNGEFKVEYINTDDYIIESYIKNPEKSRYEAVTKTQKKINILLRWKNGNGIAYPAFQIS